MSTYAVPLVFLLFSGTLLEIADIANDVSQKTVFYTEQMSLSLDCAFMGVAIEECAPELMHVDMREDLARLDNLSTRNK
ncbi:MAG TPA: hypothetical protein VK158_06430 [Acidobacteriota bacterium]|nr:hypothetical protein [Acidobacteriota bacterium]